MGKKDIIIIVAVILALGFSLYRRYIMKKNQVKGGNGHDKASGSSFSSSSKDDDYEPYSGKNK